MEQLKIVDVRYTPPLLGDVGIVCCRWLTTTQPWALHTKALAVYPQGLCIEDLQDMPLGVLEAMASVLPDAEEG